MRARLAASLVVLGFGTAVGYGFRDQILGWLQAPLHSSLYSGELLLAPLLVGILLAITVLVYGLESDLRLIALSYAITLGGVSFAYYVSVPLMLHFLLHPAIAAGSYLNFVAAYIVVFAAVLQLPLLLMYTDTWKPISVASLQGRRKWVLLGAFGIAIILPIVPDPVAQIMLALPVIVSYELSLQLVALAHRRRAGRVVTPKPVARPIPRPVRPPVQAAVRHRHPQRTHDRTVGLRSPIIDMRPSANPPQP